MKNKIKYTAGSLLITTLAAAITLAGCSRDEIPAPAAEEVTFTAGIPTRTTAGGDQWLTTDRIGVVMLDAGGTLPGDILVGGDNVEYKPDSDNVSGADLVPVGSPIYWPASGGPCDFVAYYPYLWIDPTGIDPATYNYPVNVLAQSDPAKLDILRARTNGKTKGDVVPLEFGHIMSKVRVNVIAGDGINAGDMDGIAVQLKGMPTFARLSLGDGTLSGKGSVTDITVPPVTAGSGYAYSFEAIVIPQGADVFPGRSVEFSFDTMEDMYFPIPDGTAMEAGVVRTYDLKVSGTGITLVSTGIEEWTRNDNGAVDLEQPGIYEAYQLDIFAREWNAASTDDERAAVIAKWSSNGRPDGVVRLRADIDMSSFAFFTPIGSESNNPFTGKFDGGGYTVSNLYVDRGVGSYAGLFGVIGNGGEVSNIILKDGQVYANNYAGGIAGRNEGTITGCSILVVAVGTTGATEATGHSGGIAGGNEGVITGCSILDVTVTTSNTGYVAGIAGYNHGTKARIVNCTVAGSTVIEGSSYSGGIAGRNDDGTITGCEVSGTSVTSTASHLSAGGIAGYSIGSSGRIENCTVSGNTQIESVRCAGGIAGENDGVTIINCKISAVTVKSTGGSGISGGIVGLNSNANISDCTVSGSADIEGYNYAGGIAGLNSQATITGCDVNVGSVKSSGASGCSGGIAGQNFGTITVCLISGGTVVGTGSSANSGGIAGRNTGPIVACIAAPQLISVQTAGVVAGTNSSTIEGCYWAENVITGNPAVGTGPSPDGGGSFDRNEISSFFTTGYPTPIEVMNAALEADGTTGYRWKAGTAESGWWPIPYKE